MTAIDLFAGPGGRTPVPCPAGWAAHVADCESCAEAYGDAS